MREANVGQSINFVLLLDYNLMRESGDIKLNM